MFYDILDQKRLGLLPEFSRFQDRFYLAGGTALALQLGHRDSEDFDFFSPQDFQVTSFLDELHGGLGSHKFVVTQEEKNTLSLIVDGQVKVSFFKFPYPLLNPLIQEPNINIAAIPDIACMKLSAIVSRATMKDYVDLYFVLQRMDLARLLELSRKKLPSLDKQLILKSLVYFDDVAPERLKWKSGREVPWITVKEKIIEQVKLASRLDFHST